MALLTRARIPGSVCLDPALDFTPHGSSVSHLLAQLPHLQNGETDSALRRLGDAREMMQVKDLALCL